jgi:hypothetical protein
MRRLVWIILMLIVFFAAVIGVALKLGSVHGTSTEAFSVMFTKPDGTTCETPCLFGVRPQRSTAQEATTLLETHPFIHNVLGLTAKDVKQLGNGFIIGGNNAVIEVELLANTDKVDYIFYAYDNHEFTLGQLLVLLGEPPSISFSLATIPPVFDVYLKYPDKGLEILLIYPAAGSMRLSDHLAGIYVTTVHDSPHGPLTECVLPYCMRWQGMKSISSYTANFPPFP